MNLTDEQQQQVAGWIEQGMTVAEIQKRLETDFGLRITYLQVRLLVDDLRLTPKDALKLNADEVLGKAKAAADLAQGGQPSASPGGVRVSLDTLARPGAMVSGKVTFSDGRAANWYLDQAGRLGIAPEQQGYKPSAADLQEFQIQLQSELQRAGFMG